MSQLYYGIELFNYNQNNLNKINVWVNSIIINICVINRNAPKLIYKTEFKINNSILNINKRKYKLKKKLKELNLNQLNKTLKFNIQNNSLINWKTKKFNNLEKQIQNFKINQLKQSKSWKVQNYLKIINLQSNIFQTQKYLNYPSSSIFLKFRSFTNCLYRYYYVIDKNINKFCPLCLKENKIKIIENIDHFLWVCPSYQKIRNIFIQNLIDNNLDDLYLDQNSLKLLSKINNRKIYDFTLKFLKDNLRIRASRISSISLQHK